MTEFDPENYNDDDELDLEEPFDGRDSQPPEGGSSDDPESLEDEDPLHEEEPVLTDTDTESTVTAQAVEPTEDEAVDEERVVDDDTALGKNVDEPR